MLRKSTFVLLVVVASLVFVVPAFASEGGGPPPFPDGGRARPIVFVESQGIAYHSIVGPNLPAEGPFQELVVAEDGSLSTEFGPGDVGYLGGRWWVDVDGSGTMNAGDAFFSCPLLQPVS